MKTLAVLGAGPGIGRSLASRFGREGYQVGLVARDGEHLARMVADLAAEGVDAAAFPADLTDRSTITDAVAGIVGRFGAVDVLEYGPLPTGRLEVPALEVDVDVAQDVLDLLVLGAIHAVGLVLPGMRERGDGALLFTQGVSARQPLLSHASVGMAAAGLRNWIYCLHQELAPEGVYVGTVPIGALVTRDADPEHPMAVHPDVIASAHWDLLQSRDRVEAYVGNIDAFPPPEGWS